MWLPNAGVTLTGGEWNSSDATYSTLLECNKGVQMEYNGHSTR